MTARITVAIACLFISTSGWARVRLVTSNADSGVGTLRAAIANAEDGDQIQFQVRGVIQLTSHIAIDKSVAIEGPGVNALAIDGGHATQLFEIAGQNHRVSFSDLTFQNAFWDIYRSEGSAIYLHGVVNVLHLERVKFTGNFSGLRGGAVSSYGEGEAELYPLTIEVVDSTFQDNSSNGFGGAVYAKKTILRISRSTFARNQGFEGGAIYMVNSRLELLNSTITQNYAKGSGGAIQWNVGGYALDFAFDTITENSSEFGSGGLSGGGYTVIRMRNTVLATNHGSDHPDLNVELVRSEGSNIIGDSGGVPGWRDCDLVGSANSPVDPKLGPLSDNGGPTQTELPIFGSPVIAFAQECVNWNGDPVRTDQRGVSRPIYHCDSGSVEGVK